MMWSGNGAYTISDRKNTTTPMPFLKGTHCWIDIPLEKPEEEEWVKRNIQAYKEKIQKLDQHSFHIFRDGEYVMSGKDLHDLLEEAWKNWRDMRFTVFGGEGSKE